MTLDFATSSCHYDDPKFRYTETLLQNSRHSYKYAGVNYSMGDDNAGNFSSGLVQFSAEPASSGMNASSAIFSTTIFLDVDDTSSTATTTARQEVKNFMSRDFRDLRMIGDNEYEKVIGEFRDEDQDICYATENNSTSYLYFP